MNDLLAVSALLLPVFAVAGLALHVLTLRRREQAMASRLAEQRAARFAESATRIRADHAAELSRTLHDDIGHRLTLTSIEAAVLQTKAGGDLATDLDHLRTGLAEAVEALNRSVTGLASGDAGGELEDRISRVVRGLVEVGVVARLSVDLAVEPPADVADVVLAVVREACTNALRHAPGAPVDVRVAEESGACVVLVANGPATPGGERPVHSGAGRGLAGLSERVGQLGGSLQSGLCAGGWSLRAAIPLDGRDEELTRVADQRRRARRRLVVVPLLLAVLVAAGPVLLVLGQAALSRIDPAAFASIRVGDSEQQARARLPRIGMEAPPPQVGTGQCRHHEATFSPFDRTEVYEVCFTDGRVSSTTIIPAP